MKHRLKTLALAAAMMGSQFPAYAGHPYITDNTGTIGAGNWQLELMAEKGTHSNSVNGESQKDGYKLFTPVLTRALSDTLDVALGLSHLNIDGGDSGKGDTALELKWRFYEQDGLSLGLKPGIYFATGDETRGLGNGRTSYGLNFLVNQEIEKLTLLGNIAFNRNNYAPALQDSSRSDLWRVSAGFGYKLTDTLSLVGELGAKTNQAKNDDYYPGSVARFGMLGMVYSPTSEIDLDFGIRKGLNKAENDTVYLLGATFRW
jgi:hypothetical protein